ncbi:hypothetical protein ABEH22_13785 [Pantoea agglomerans]|uniref:hypothetical protein n=1 Tax=Enterobacter agglomerans TaxID=549 RepID=UPI002D77A98F|nr:hypothetical protein [Pantoea agglomerans]WRO88850.1 hypothetical protein U9K49_11385 [Pantoea agglomerans]
MSAFWTVLHSEDGKIIGLQYQGQIESTDQFINLMHFIEGKARYIERHNPVLVLPIGFSIASVLGYETNISKLLDTYAFIRLMISEEFPNLIDGRKNRLLDELSQRYKLWLGNLGSGARTNLIAVMEGCFDALILDERFTQGNRDKAIFPAVLNEMSKYTNNLIVPGFNTGRYRPVRLSHIEQLM